VHFHLLRALDLPLAFEVKLASPTHGSLVHYNFMAYDDPILAARRLRAPSANQYWWFNLNDIVLGGSDSMHTLMDAFRKFMEASSARVSGTMK
jgi:hypothetical protein